MSVDDDEQFENLAGQLENRLHLEDLAARAEQIPTAENLRIYLLDYLQTAAPEELAVMIEALREVNC
jgi:hypothetical protein